jgi:queuine tRNA-ribosyltransferase
MSLGGLHEMAGWPHPIVTDSGGFQAYSMIRQNPRFGKLNDKGLIFQPEGAERKFQLTPEKSVQMQVSFGADVVICLDDCTHVDAPLVEQEVSVARTIRWAKRCKDEFLRLMDQKKVEAADRPLLFGVAQGGADERLRRECAGALLEIGFDGFGYGGWPLDQQGNLVADTLALTRSLIPNEYPMHALGIGHPENVVACARLGYAIFDSALPTRDARNGRLYAFAESPDDAEFRLSGDWLRYVYIGDQKRIKAKEPISPGCDCLACHRYSVGYVHHLYKSGDPLYHRLATLHNLRFMSRLTALIRSEASDGTLSD